MLKYEPDDLEVLNVRDLKRELLYFKENKGRYWARSFMEYRGLGYLLEIAEIDTIKKVFSEVADNAMMGKRLGDRLEQYACDLLMLKKLENKKTYRILYDEVREKLLKAA